MSGQIGVLYVSYDELEITMGILQRFREFEENHDIGLMNVASNQFPWAKQLLSIPEPDQPAKVVILHMMAGCHELGYPRETDQGFSTGLRRAEILREQGYEGEIILLSTADEGLRRRVTHDYDTRVAKARVHFVGYGNGFQDIVDIVRRVGHSQG